MISSTPEIAALEAVFGRYLALVGDAEAGAALYEAYAADAPLCLRYEVVPRRALARDEFAYLMAAGFRLHAQEHPDRPRRPELADVTCVAASLEGDRAVAWFDAREATAGHALHVAAGFTREDGGWKVHWATLAAERAEWTFELGLAQTVSDFSFAEGAGMLAPRSWLDVAYFRLHDKPRPPLLVLPEARFGCQSSGICCNIGFEVDVPGGAQAVLDALPWEQIRPELAGTQLGRRPDGRLQLKTSAEACRFLDENKHCVLHKALGRAVFPICAAYPMMFTHTPDGVVATPTTTCPSARAGLGPPLAERAEDLYTRMAMKPQAPAPDLYALAPDLLVTWEAYREAEAELLALVADESLPLVERLYRGEAALRRRIGIAPLPATRPVADRAERAERRAYLAGFDARLGATPPDQPAEIAVTWPMPQEAELVTMLRNVLFEKAYAFGSDLLTAWHVAVFMAMLVLHLQAYHADRRVPDRMFWRLNGFFRHQAVFKALTGSEDEAREMKDDFGRLDFGVELLSLPVDGPAAVAADGAGWKLIGNEDIDAIEAFLASEPLANLSFLDGIAEIRALGYDFSLLGWYGWRSGGRWRAFTTTRRCLSFYAPDPAAHDALAAFLADHVAGAPWILAPEPAAGHVVARVTPPAGMRAEDRLHQIMTLVAEDLVCPDPDPAVRLATLADLDEVTANDAAMLREESGHDPLADDAEGFRGTIARRIEAGRVFVLEEGGRIRYQISLGFCQPGLAELINAFTPPEFRRQGYARRGLPQACRLALRAYGKLFLMPRVDHRAIIALDEAVGFKTTELRVREVVWSEA